MQKCAYILCTRFRVQSQPSTAVGQNENKILAGFWPGSSYFFVDNNLNFAQKKNVKLIKVLNSLYGMLCVL